MAIKIGTLRDGTEVHISNTAPNKSIAILGIPGTGKSTRIDEITFSLLEEGQTVIYFDLEGVVKNFSPEISNYIDLNEEGINLKLLNTSHVKEKQETYVNYVAYVTELLTGTHKMGCRQQGIVREAVEYATDHIDEDKTDLEAIQDALKMIDSKGTAGVYNKLWPVLSTNVLRADGKSIVAKKVNIISFGKMPTSSQKALVEIILGIIWRESRFLGVEKQMITLVIDEVQRLNLSGKGIIMELFTQGRKYGINLIVASQTSAFLSGDVKVAINLANTRLYFKPSNSDVKKVAELISVQEAEKYILLLKRLKVGEAIAVGEFEIAQKIFDKPLVTQSVYKASINKSNPMKALLLEQKNKS